MFQTELRTRLLTGFLPSFRTVLPTVNLYKILIVTLLLLAVALGVNYWLRTQGFPALKNWFENVSEGWDEEDEMTEDDLSIDWDIDWDNAPRVLDEEEPVDELMDEETDNTEEDLALPIYEEVE